MIHGAIGIVGAIFYLSAYALLQMGRLKSSDVAYLLMNGVGSIFIIISLTREFNLPAFIVQFVWLIITVVSLARIYHQRRKT